MQLSKDGRKWRIGAAAEVEWIAGHTTAGTSITTAIPPIFDAYATTHQPDGVTVAAYEHALVQDLTAQTPEQPWWLAYLDTGPHDIVFPRGPRVSLYWNWPYVLIEVGPEQALTWRTGHMRHGDGSLPDLFFPADRSWLVSALWDDTWTCLGGPEPLINTLQQNPLANTRRVRPDEDALPPGLTRE
ncbi:hypothetical protein [Verrucosispora sp. NA02020]|uniref:hypothetical protein n=1 Tax=Verrucosispora sp. NA02020 TaxID=2742132 RepID=UPI00159061E1|nr:hypothetical protein [Verrucosispora sp. NA02020]QKW13639.1 hypothetical protein HUT12_13165 [Verrucosispora sp. NA02020]